MADEFAAGVNFGHVFMNALGQLIPGKLGERAAEGGFAGHVAGAFPAAELAEPGAGAQGIEECGGGGELINALGDESVGQPDARARRTAFAAPRIAAGEAAQLGEREDSAELFVQRGEFAQLLGEDGKELALQVMEDHGEVEHTYCQTPTPTRRSIIPGKFVNKIEF